MKSVAVCAGALLYALLLTRPGADGFKPMPLEDVLQDADSVILVDVVENDGTVTHREQPSGVDGDAYDYTNNIKARVIRTLLGDFVGDEFVTRYSETLVKDEVLLTPASGLETRMKVGERYVLILRRSHDGYALQRAEEPTRLDEVLVLRKKLDDEDRQIAHAQVKIPNGFYHFASDSDAQKIRLAGGGRRHLGAPCKLRIAQKKLDEQNGYYLLSLTLEEKGPHTCILVVGGNAYLVGENHLGAERSAPGTAEKPQLFCILRTKAAADSIAAYFEIDIAGP